MQFISSAQVTKSYLFLEEDPRCRPIYESIRDTNNIYFSIRSISSPNNYTDRFKSQEKLVFSYPGFDQATVKTENGWESARTYNILFNTIGYPSIIPHHEFVGFYGCQLVPGHGVLFRKDGSYFTVNLNDKSRKSHYTLLRIDTGRFVGKQLLIYTWLPNNL